MNAEPPRVRGVQRLIGFLEGPHSKRGYLMRYWRLRDQGAAPDSPMCLVLLRAYRGEVHI